MLLSLLVVPLSHADAPKCGPPSESQKTDFGVYVDDARTLMPGIPQLISANVPSRYLRVHIRVKAQPPRKWVLRLYDNLGRPLETVDSQGASSDFWTSRLPVSQISMVAEAEGAEPVLETVEHMEMPERTKAHYYSIQSATPNWLPLYKPSIPGNRRLRGESVGMLFATYGSNVIGHYNWTCSGVLVNGTPPIFVTAAHCGAPDDFPALSWSTAIRTRMLIDFSWDGDVVSREFELAAKNPIIDKEKDIAVLELRPRDGLGSPRPALLRDASPTSGEEVYLIHHPASEEKRISAGCRIEGDQAGTASAFTHRCDSESGSSGAPVFDDGGTVVGLHLRGYEKTESGGCDNTNKAISSQSLVKFMRENGVPFAAKP